MELVTETNIDITPFKNIKEVLDANTLSIPIKPTYSRDIDIPLTVMELDSRTVSTKMGRSSSGSRIYVVTATLHNISSYIRHATNHGAIDIRSEMRNLLIAAEDTFSQYNMDINISSMEDNLTQIQRGEGRAHDAILIVRFIVK